MADRDLVLLVEGDNARLRPALLPVNASLLVERPHTREGLSLPERRWRWRGERAETGQRVFREELPVVAPEPSECPEFDELVIRGPIPLRELH